MKNLFTGCFAAFLCCAMLYGQGDGYQFSTTSKLDAQYSSPFLSKGNVIMNFNTAFTGEFGKNRFDNADNTSKPSQLNWNAGFGAEKMVNDHLAVGAFIGTNIGINKDKESDNKFVTSSILGGPMATCYKPCGEAENGGIMSMAALFGGIERTTYTSGDQKLKDPIAGVIGANIDLGGYYQPTENVLFTASLGMIGFQTHFMPMNDGGSTPDMVTTDFSFGWQDFDLNLGVRAVLGNNERE